MEYINYLNPPIIFLIAGVILTGVVYYIGPLLISYIAKFMKINKEKSMNLFQIPLLISIVLSSIWYSIHTSSYYHIVESWYTPVILTILLIFWIRGIIDFGKYILRKTIKQEKENHNIIPIIENIWVFIAIISMIFSVLHVWEINVKPFLASAGIAGVIIGFAARDTLENFFGGIALYADQTYYIGDFIELDESTRGWVREISIRSTVIHTLDGDSVTIPNSKLHKSIIKNKSHPKNAFRTSIDIGVSYDSDTDKVHDILEETMDEIINNDDNLVLDNPRHQVHLREFSDSAITFEIFVWIKLPNQKPTIENLINKRIYAALNKEGIKIPYPQRTLHFEK